MKKYYALIIDIVKSRKLNDQDRFDVQKKLDKAIKIMNYVFENKIIKSLNFSAGDSVQGLFGSIADTYNAYFFIKSAVFPHSIRAGIGYGRINEFIFNKFNDYDSNKYDGEAYHLSKIAIEIARKTEQPLVLKINNRFDQFINPLLDDEKLISMTQQRKAIYSLINLINPLIYNIEEIRSEYLRAVIPLVTEIANFYRNKSIRLQPKQSEISWQLEDKEVYKYMENYYGKSSYILKSEVDSIMVDAPLRFLLVDLTSTKKQNIDSLVRVSQVDYLRTRIYSKIKIMEYFYEELEK